VNGVDVAVFDAPMNQSLSDPVTQYSLLFEANRTLGIVRSSGTVNPRSL
jgi:hypothetical protein